MDNYKEYAVELRELGTNLLPTTIQTNLTDKYKVISVYADICYWQTALWFGETKVHNYETRIDADDIVTLHSEITKDYYENGMFFKEKELLRELKTNLCDEWLNESDSSVGIYPVGDLVHWANNDLKDAEGVTLLSVTKDNAIIECESLLFEIYGIVERTAPEETDFYWSIRLHDKKD